jgi:diadenosine tetraphosphate (Ap4A) HIT family hydrolase
MASDTKNSSEPAWKSFSKEKLAEIDKARKEAEEKNQPQDPKGTYGLVCRACSKPNAIHVTFCTGCSFPSSKWDIQRLPDNIFLELVKGKDIGAKVHFRDNEVIVFDDKFGVSDNHLDVIPCTVYDDITVLTKEHIPVLELMYQRGIEEFTKRKIPWLQGQNIEDFVSSGYNYPVSVKHLHVHMILPPFKHHKILQYPRWHSTQKVLGDLKKYGKVQLYEQQPNDAEGKAVYDRAMENEKKALELIAKLQPKT